METNRPEPPAAEEMAGTQPPLEEQLRSALAERDANYERFLRAQAELENYRKRAQREGEEARRYAALPIVRDLLPVLDNLRRARDAAREAGQAPDLVEGIDLVCQQIEAVLARHGVTPIPAEGQTFDPHCHEAVQQVASDEHPPLSVLQELERGYRLHERVVRPSKVIVSQSAGS